MNRFPFFALLTAVCIGSGALAQGVDSPAETAPSEAPTEAVPQSPAAAPPVLEAWETLAARAEATAEAGVASNFALTRLRDELFIWRDAFSEDQEINAGRIATVDAQLEALGPVPESGDEPQAIADRRARLQAERDRLSVPAMLANASRARANGLIAELDTLIRARDTQRLTTRGASPLNPAYWSQGRAALTQGISTLVSSSAQRLSLSVHNGGLMRDVPVAAGALVLALFLMIQGRRMAIRARDRIQLASSRWRPVWVFLVSLGQILLPMIGLLLLLFGLSRFDLLDLPGADLAQALFGAGMIVILARWLNGLLFPLGEANGPLGYDLDTRKTIRRAGIALGIAMAIDLALREIVILGDPALIAIEVIVWPWKLVLAILLFQLGRALRTPPCQDDLPGGAGGRVRGVLGRAAMLVALAYPVLSGLGYGAASQAIFMPFVLSLAMLGLLIVLQKLAIDIYGAADTVEGDGPLMPVLIGIGLFLVSLPFLALIWGARVADLVEVWTRFQAGLTLGETQVTPGDVLTFALVFGLVYLLTGFIQNTLRKSVLPRTRLDLGAQNAVVSGVGYVGMFLAAIIAITSAGIDLSNLAIVAGALSLGIGFGLQNIVQNFVSGVILLIERPIGEGDMIEVNGQTGYVRGISVRSTRIETFDRTDVIIPNADLVSGQVTNWTRGNAAGRLILPVGVAYGSDIERVKEILLEIANAQPMALSDPEPQVLFLAFGASSLDFEVRVILRDVAWKMVVTSEMNQQINARFAEAGIEIPFPQQDLWLRNPETLRSDDKGEPDT